MPPGGRGTNGNPVIIFPEFPAFDELQEDEIQNVLGYLTSVPRYLHPSIKKKQPIKQNLSYKIKNGQSKKLILISVVSIVQSAKVGLLNLLYICGQNCHAGFSSRNDIDTFVVLVVVQCGVVV